MYDGCIDLLLGGSGVAVHVTVENCREERKANPSNTRHKIVYLYPAYPVRDGRVETTASNTSLGIYIIDYPILV